MRTKALLLAAAFAAAGVSTSVAQAVYSVNAVGYVNVALPAGFSLVSNPLDAGAGNNTVEKLFAPANVSPSLPNNSKVYIFDNPTGQFITVTFSPLSHAWSPAGAAGAGIEITPGNGVFFGNPSASPITVTFVGQVMQGNLSNPIPLGFSIKANQVPQAVAPNAAGVGYPGENNDKLYTLNAQGSYDTYTFSPLSHAWNPALPVIPVGTAFYAYRATSAGTWNRTFSVNN
jgi:hypothetical protein